MSNFQGLFEVREAKPTDRNFILATMLRGVYYGDSWFSKIPKDIFMDNYKYALEALLDNNNTIINIACLPEDPDVILGYSILGDTYQTVHWIYVKSAWRKKGIAKALMPQVPETITHLTAVGEVLMKKYPSAVFNPFKINQ